MAWGGEKETAKRMLERLLSKHKISLDELLSEQTAWHKFPYKSDAQKKLLYQIVFLVLKVGSFKYHKGRGRFIELKVTKAQAIDIREHFNHYRPALERHLEEALEAFIHANDIGNPEPEKDDSERPELTPEQLARLRRIAGMMYATTPTPPLRKMLMG